MRIYGSRFYCFHSTKCKYFHMVDILLFKNNINKKREKNTHTWNNNEHLKWEIGFLLKLHDGLLKIYCLTIKFISFVLNKIDAFCVNFNVNYLRFGNNRTRDLEIHAFHSTNAAIVRIIICVGSIYLLCRATFRIRYRMLTIKSE